MSGNTVKYEIIRETGNIYDKNASWLNRYVQDPESKVRSPPLDSLMDRKFFTTASRGRRTDSRSIKVGKMDQSSQRESHALKGKDKLVSVWATSQLLSTINIISFQNSIPKPVSLSMAKSIIGRVTEIFMTNRRVKSSPISRPHGWRAPVIRLEHSSSPHMRGCKT